MSVLLEKYVLFCEALYPTVPVPVLSPPLKLTVMPVLKSPFSPLTVIPPDKAAAFAAPLNAHNIKNIKIVLAILFCLWSPIRYGTNIIKHITLAGNYWKWVWSGVVKPES